MKSKTLSRMMYGCLFVGGIIALGGAYSQLHKPSQYPNLERYYQIRGKLNTPIKIKLENLESKSTELIIYRDKLKDERKKITQSPDFTETQKNYHSEQEKEFKTAMYLAAGGFGIALLSFIPSYFLEKEKKKRRNVGE